MRLDIELHDTKAFSINNYYYGTRRIRTREARGWGERIHRQLAVYRYLMVDFFNEFDPNKHVLHCHIMFGMPNLFNKRGEVNHFAKDLSNIEKPLLDIVTGKKYFDRGEPTLNIDDKFITKLISEKVPSNSYNIKLSFTIESIPDII